LKKPTTKQLNHFFEYSSRLLLSLLALVVINSLAAQTFDPSVPISQLTYTQWTTKDGLSSSNTTDVMADHHGMLWITSYNGYMTFDAERIEIYDKSNTPLLETDGFLTVSQAPNLDIYFGSQGSGLLKYSRGDLAVIESSNLPLPKSVRSLVIDEESTVYFGGQNAGLYIMKNDSIVKHPGKSIETITILSIEKGNQGDLWIGTEGKGVFHISPDTIINYSLKQGLLSNYVGDLHIHDNGKVAVATPRGLHWIEKGKVSVIEELRGIYVNKFLFDEWNTIWLGGEAGLFRFHLDSRKLEELKGFRNIDFVRISAIKKDNFGSIWLCSSRSGLINIKESQVFNISKPVLSSNRVHIVHEDRNGQIFIGTDQNHLEIWKNNQISILPIKTNLIGNGVRGIWDEPDGTLWLATYGGIVKYDHGQETLYSTATGMPANNFRVVIKDQFDQFWFGTRSGGLVKFKDGEIQKVYDLGNGLGSNFVLALTEGADGSIYVGTNGGGMTIIDPSEEISTFHVKEEDSGILIFNIDLQPNGTAFLTTNIGPAHFDGAQIIPIKLDLSGGSSTYFDIVPDYKDHLWMTTNNGIYKISKKDWHDYVKGKITQVPFTVINEMSGMNNRECTGATKSSIDSRGVMYFPTLGGVCIIDPNKTEPEQSEAVVQVKRVIADNQQHSIFQQPLLLAPGINRIDFQYSLLSFSTIGQNRYRYQLRGFDNQKSAVTSNAQVSYTNIPPGDYTFEVEASIDGKHWSTVPATFNINVQPFFYETYIFYVLLVMSALIILYLIYQWRLSFINRQNMKLKKVNAELDRFVYSASHELRSPLSSVLGLVSLAKDEVEGTATEYLNHIETSVKRLDAFIKDIIDYSRNTRLEVANDLIDFDAMINGIFDDISYTDHFRQIECNFQNNQKKPFHCDARRLKVAISNLINNAVKHHDPENIPEPFVSVILNQDSEHIKIAIEDNGPGIEEEYQQDIFKMFYRATVRTEGSGLGLYIVHEIVEKLNGQLEFSSTPGVGTRFELILPCPSST
jgi:signal transduction histidine kinase/ligand-binding sensor domain-containing protein